MTDMLSLRVRAAEHLLRALAQCIDDDVLDDAAATLMAELSEDLPAEERATREVALELLMQMSARDVAGLLSAWRGGSDAAGP